MHDVTYSQDSPDEYIIVPIPAGDPDFDPNGIFLFAIFVTYLIVKALEMSRLRWHVLSKQMEQVLGIYQERMPIWPQRGLMLRVYVVIVITKSSKRPLK